jgi:hypothetical protein
LADKKVSRKVAKAQRKEKRRRKQYKKLGVLATLRETFPLSIAFA